MYNKNVVLPNAPGTIDSDYRGEIKIPLRNLLPHTAVTFKKGERIAQVVIKKVPRVEIEYLNPDQFASNVATSRSYGGFGSTGTGITDL